MKLGTVVGINLSDDDFTSFNSIIVSTKYSGTASLLRCYPLSPNSRSIPVIGEQVYVIVANSDEASGVTGATRNYYTSVVGLQGNVNHNALPGSSKIIPTETPNFSQVENGIPLQDNNQIDEDLGIGFKEVEDLSQLQPFLGDIIHEGRFGQSIRFGSTPEGTDKSDNKINGSSEVPSWTSTSPESPITIIRNGAGVSKGYNKFIIEDVNRDDSSLWLTSKQTVGLTLSSNLPLGVTPIGSWSNPQIILNSDRVVVNTKTDELIMSSGKDITVTTSTNTTSIDRIVEVLEEILKGKYPTAVGPSGPHPLIATLLPKLKNGA